MGKFFAGLGLTTLTSFLFFLFFLNHTAPQEIGVAYNSVTGEVTVQEHPGWYVTHPLVFVATIDTRPFQVCIGAGARVLNCKLIRFKPEGVKEFVHLQGFHYWNGIPTSCTSGLSDSRQSCYGISGVLMGYAYADRPYSFLEILEEIKPNKVY